MTITLNLDDEMEHSLQAKAEERGMTLGAYLDDLVQKEARSARELRRPGREKADAFVKWAASHRATPPLSDEAISRAAMYPNRL
ncbi:MAG: hypothetical protein NTZ56_09145 [Acidobacteria bacterium]|nr:hypothetical protein [Acidobacteriota bacterium]